MNDFNRRVLPDNDPLLRSQSLLPPSRHHHHTSTTTTSGNDDGDSQSVDYNDDNLINYDLEDNFHGIESNFDEPNMINESENIDLYKQQQQNSNTASRLSNNNILKKFQKTAINDNSKRMVSKGKTSSIKTNGFNNSNNNNNNNNNSKSYSQNTGFNRGQNQSLRIKQIKFSDEQSDELSPPGNHHVLHPTGYSYVTGESDIWSKMLIFISYFFLVISFPLSLCACIKVAQEYERAVVFRLGRIIDGGHKGPGIFFILPCVDTYMKVDLRTVTFDVPPQEILTKDSVTVSVDAVVYFRIFNAVISVVNVEDAAKSTKLLAASTLRNVLGTKSLHEILSDRETVASLIQNTLLAATSPWGVQVERVEVKDVRLPVQLQRAMATEAEAAREAKAKVIAAEGEKKASYALKEAALVISQSPVAIQLRYLQTLTTIASERNSTIVFPIPMELISRTFSKFQQKMSSTTNKPPTSSKAVSNSEQPQIQIEEEERGKEKVSTIINSN